jgi:general nucleoside transport system permease protein
MNEAFLVSILAVTVRAGASLLYATVGEILTERSGVLNLGVEGIMIMGALIGFAAAYHSGSLVIGILAAMLIGGLLAGLHAFLSISLRADQVVSGLVLTIFGTGMANFLGQKLGPNGGPLVGLVGPKFLRQPFPGLRQLPFLGPSFFDQDVLVYILYLLVPVVWIYLYKTRPGLHVRAVGENPHTADAMGVNVYGVRYLYTIVGGMLIAVGGAHLSLAYTPGWTDSLTGGRGWIAVALVIFAAWDPLRAVVGAILFGGVNAVQFRLQAAGTTIPASFLGMMPYIFTIIVLVLITWWEAFSRKVRAPAALGQVFTREERG